jgi:hypothetical protein
MAVKYKDRNAPLTIPSLGEIQVNPVGLDDNDFFVTDIVKKECFGGLFALHAYGAAGSTTREASSCLFSVNDAGFITVIAGGNSTVSYLADLDGGSATNDNIVLGWYQVGGSGTEYLGVKHTFANDTDLKIKLTRLM